MKRIDNLARKRFYGKEKMIFFTKLNFVSWNPFPIFGSFLKKPGFLGLTKVATHAKNKKTDFLKNLFENPSSKTEILTTFNHQENAPRSPQ